MQVYRRRDKGRFHPLLKVLLALALVVGVSFSLAWVWQATEQSVAAETQAEAEEPEERASSLAATAQQNNQAAQEEQAVRPPSQEEAAQEQEEKPAARTVSEGAVPESPAVDAAYFDDAIFLGDSITTGIPLYHIADNAAVVAMTGINTDNINHKACIRVGDSEERVTVLEAAKAHGERGKVYIMLGGNSLGLDKAAFLAGYKTFLDSVKEQYPQAAIYLQSMTPVVDGYVNEFDPTMDNEKIDAYNLEIMALAKREQVYYLDVASALKDENGALPTEASPVDGMHFSPEYYTKWFEYLKTHTVEEGR